jgi:uncharacterized protein YjbI with pentapeptide repeats
LTKRSRVSTWILGFYFSGLKILGGADLHGANLRGAHLNAANLEQADVTKADFVEANLGRTLLTPQISGGRTLIGRALTVTDLDSAHLNHTIYEPISPHLSFLSQLVLGSEL